MSTTLPAAGDSQRISPRDRREYDRLRTLARNAADKRGDYFKRAREAYNRRNGALASQLSMEGKKHGKQMNRYNKRAWKFVFKLNNLGRPPTIIDLHDLFVKEAMACLLKRMNEVKASGEEQIRVIVGLGIHAPGGQPRIKPAVEKLCRDRGLAFSYQKNGNVENQGMIIILLEDYEVENIEGTRDTEGSDMDLGDVGDSEEESYSNAPVSGRLTTPSSPSPPPSSPAPPPYTGPSTVRQPYISPPVQSYHYTPPVYQPVAPSPSTSQSHTNTRQSQPTSYTPARPTPYTPARPTPSTPARPTPYTPARPTPSTPARPTSYTPIRSASYTPARPQYSYQSIDAAERGVPAGPEGDCGGCGWFGTFVLVATIIGLGVFFFV